MILFILIFNMKFIIQFFLFTVLILGLLVGLVTSVDPYDKLHNNPWGFETKAVAQSRENKFILLENSKTPYEAFILGSSAAHRYPTKVLSELSGYQSFNYAAQHTNPEDYLAMLRHILSKHKPKLVLMQIGFIELDANFKTDNRLYNSPLAKFLKEQKKDDSLFDNNYFTLDAIRDSLRVIFVNKFGKALHSNYIEHGDYVYKKPSPGKVTVQQSSYEGWTLSKERVQYLKEIKNLCEAEGIQLIVFTAPLSYEHYQIAIAHPRHEIYLKTLTEIFGDIWNFHDESIKNYSTYMEFINSTHMTHEFSATILRRMFTGQPEGLGKKISK